MSTTFHPTIVNAAAVQSTTRTQHTSEKYSSNKRDMVTLLTLIAAVAGAVASFFLDSSLGFLGSVLVGTLTVVFRLLISEEGDQTTLITQHRDMMVASDLKVETLRRTLVAVEKKVTALSEHLPYELVRQAEGLKQEIQALTEKRSQTSSTLSAKQTEFTQLQEQVRTLAKEVESQTTLKKEAEATLKDVQQRIIASRTELSNLHTEIGKEKPLLDSLQSKVAQAQQQLNKANAAIQTAQPQAAQLKKELVRLEEQVQKATANKDICEFAIRSAKEREATLEAQIKDLQSQASQLTTETSKVASALTHKQAALMETQAKIDKTKPQLDQLTHELQMIETQKTATESTVAGLTKQVAQLEKKSVALNEKVKEEKSILQSTTAEHTRLGKENLVAQAALTERQTELVALGKQVELKARDVAKLERDCTLLHDEMESTQETLHSVQGKKKEAISQVAGLEIQLSALERQVKLEAKDAAILEREIADKGDVKEYLEAVETQTAIK